MLRSLQYHCPPPNELPVMIQRRSAAISAVMASLLVTVVEPSAWPSSSSSRSQCTCGWINHAMYAV